MYRKKYFVYILLCADKSYYTGITNNIDLRFAQHEEGIDPDAYTYSRRPLQLVWAEAFSNVYTALEWEKRIKKWSRAKKEALINDDWSALKKHATCKNETHSKRLLDQPGYQPKEFYREMEKQYRKENGEGKIAEAGKKSKNENGLALRQTQSARPDKTLKTS